jgi:indolepyruvate decarboxylase
MGTEFTVGGYLVERLSQLGLEHLFSIAGDYTIKWVDNYVRPSNIHVIEEVNELNAGYAADGYARLKGIGALCVTYAAGGLSAANAVAGAYAERVPLVLISGAPSIGQTLTFEQTGFSAHHFIGGRDTVLSVFEPITAASVRIDNPVRAPALIDSALIQCLTEKRPIYIEILQDMFHQPCEPPPKEKLKPARVSSDGDSLTLSVDTVAGRLATAANPLVWVGVEIDRFGLQDAAGRLIQQLKIPFVTEFLCKAVLSENDPLFAGVFDGNSSSAVVQDLVKTSDFILALGVWPTDINWLGLRTGSKDWGVDFAKISFASSYTVKWGTFFSPQVSLADLIDGLATRGVTCKPGTVSQRPGLAEPDVSLRDPISYQGFYEFIQKYVGENTIVGADPSLNYFGCMALKVSARGGFIAQSSYSSIGYIAAAATGLSLAKTNNQRVMVFSGDGGFQMTAQCLSTQTRFELNPIIFVIDNGVYAVEQWLADASPFQPGATSTTFYPSCKLHPWDYRKLADVFGRPCLGQSAGTYGELQDAIAEALKNLAGPSIIQVVVPQNSIPDTGLWKTN